MYLRLQFILCFVLSIYAAQSADLPFLTTPSVNPAVPTNPSVNPAFPTTPSVNPAIPTNPSVNPAVPTNPSINPAVTIIPSDGIIKACVGTVLHLTCIIKGYSVGHWSSNEYIGSQNGHLLEFEQRQLHRNLTSTIDANTTASLVNTYEEDGFVVLKINLECTVTVGSIFICGGGGNEKNITLVVGRSVEICIVPRARIINPITSYCRFKLHHNWHAHKISYYQPNRGGPYQSW